MVKLLNQLIGYLRGLADVGRSVASERPVDELSDLLLMEPYELRT